MLRPTITARIEKEDRLTTGWVHRGQICSLQQITIAAGQRQVVQDTRAAVLNGHYVVWLVRDYSICLMPQPVLAAAGRALPIGPPNLRWNESAAHVYARTCKRAWPVLSA